MRKMISIFAGVAALFLIGVGALAAVGTWTSTSALAGSTIDPLAMMTSGMGLTYFVVSVGIAKIRVKWERVSADQLVDGEIYQPVTCTASGRTHLVNSKSGTVLESGMTSTAS